MLSSSRFRLAKMAAAATAGVAALLAVPSAALADEGDRTKVTYCGDLNAAGHAKTRFCSVTWGKNIYDGTYWQIVSTQLTDSMTDGSCAYGWFSNNATGVRFQECNGNWYSRTQRYNGRAGGIVVAIGAVPNGPAPMDMRYHDSVTLYPPSGF